MSDKFYKFDCGCQFKILGDPVFPNSDIPSIEIDWDNISVDCKATWDLLSSGKTKMCFQVESGLGRQWTKKLKPEHIEHMAALGSILRPGSLKAVDENDVSMTTHYCLRKNGEEEVKPYHPVVDEVLKETYNTLIFQESSILLSEKIANFSKQEADRVRKSAGKKDSLEMSKVKKLFIEKAKEAQVVTEKQAAEIFGWIEKSNRYAFNKSVLPNTLCQTETGYKTLEEIQIGEKVNSPDGFVEVKGKFDHGEQEVYQITLASGKQIGCTMEHKFLCEDGEIRPLNDILLENHKISCLLQMESIIKIEKLGKLPTVDIEVNSKNHIYYGNGIATSNSHAVSYGILGYECAFSKVHLPHIAYTSWLRDAKNKPKPFEEVAELISDAKTFGFEVYPPSFFDLKINFQTDGNKVLTAGLSNIKGIGEAQVKKLIDQIKEIENKYKSIQSMTWYEFLILVGSEISKTVMEGVIQVGGLRKLGELRSKMMKEYEILTELRDNEIEWIKQKYKEFKSLADGIEAVGDFKRQKGEISIAKRSKKAILENKPNTDIERSIVLKDLANILRNPISPYRDNPAEIAANEERLLGAALTCSLADAKPGERFSMTCKDLLDNPSTKAMIILKVKVDDVRTHTIKKGKEENIGREMAFLKVSDGTCSVEDISCFADQWEDFKDLLMVGRVLEIQLDRGYTPKGAKPNNRLHVKEVWQI